MSKTICFGEYILMEGTLKKNNNLTKHDKGKLSEKIGRKVMGLKPYTKVMTAILPAFFIWPISYIIN